MNLYKQEIVINLEILIILLNVDICCIHCVGETAENVIKTLPTSLRPIYEVSLSGWCENESNGTYYSCIARLKKDGTWGYVSAFTAFSGDNLYYIYNQSGTNRLKNFLLWLSGAWATSYNGY